MCRQASRTFYLNPIVENSHMNVICYRIVSVQNGVRDYFVQCFGRIIDWFQALRAKNLDVTNYLFCDVPPVCLMRSYAHPSTLIRIAY